MSKCDVCKRDLSPNSRSDKCQRCRAARRYWMRPEKGVHAVIERAKTLKVWEDRMLWLAAEEPGFRRAKRAFKQLRAADHER